MPIASKSKLNIYYCKCRCAIGPVSKVHLVLSKNKEQVVRKASLLYCYSLLGLNQLVSFFKIKFYPVSSSIQLLIFKAEARIWEMDTCLKSRRSSNQFAVTTSTSVSALEIPLWRSESPERLLKLKLKEPVKIEA